MSKTSSLLSRIWYTEKIHIEFTLLNKTNEFFLFSIRLLIIKNFFFLFLHTKRTTQEYATKYNDAYIWDSQFHLMLMLWLPQHSLRERARFEIGCVWKKFKNALQDQRSEREQINTLSAWQTMRTIEIDRDNPNYGRCWAYTQHTHTDAHTLTHTRTRITLSPSAFVRALPPCYYHLRDTLHATTAPLCASLLFRLSSLLFRFILFTRFVRLRVYMCSRLIAIRSITAGMMMHRVALVLCIASLIQNETRSMPVVKTNESKQRMRLREHYTKRNTPTIWTIMRGKGSSEFQHQLWH